MAKFIPNKKLPPGARRLDPPIQLTTVSWSRELRFDAEREFLGIRWLRVFRGFGGQNDREDWIAEIQTISTSISDYNWAGTFPGFGTKYPSMEAAMIGELRLARGFAADKIEEFNQKLDAAWRDVTTLDKALSQVKGKNITRM